MSKQLNYLRQVKSFMASPRYLMKPSNPDFLIFESMMASTGDFVKFVLPKGGKILNDRLRGLPEDFRLPFPKIVLEYEAEDWVENGVASPKRIVFAQEIDISKIEIFVVYSIVENGVEAWQFTPALARVCRVSEDDPAPLVPEDAEIVRDDLISIFCSTGTLAHELWGDEWVENAQLEMSNEMCAVLELIEALSCSNVSHESLPMRRLAKSAAKRGALPFDEYKVLVVTNKDRNDMNICQSFGDRRSPREHLRRGHVRRYTNGLRVWIQSCVVNAGAGGRIHNDYLVSA